MQMSERFIIELLPGRGVSGVLPSLRGLRLLGRLRFGSFPNLDPAGSRSRGRRHGDLEDAILEGRFRLLGIDPLGQRDCAVEAPVGPLAPEESSPPFLVLLTTLAGNDELPILDL